MIVDKHPHCIGCPVIKYCGTMVASTLLCATDNIGIVPMNLHINNKDINVCINSLGEYQMCQENYSWQV